MNLGETLYVCFIILLTIVDVLFLGVMVTGSRIQIPAQPPSIKHGYCQRWLILPSKQTIYCCVIESEITWVYIALTEGLDEAKAFSEMPQQLRHEAFKLLRVPQLKSSSVEIAHQPFCKFCLRCSCAPLLRVTSSASWERALEMFFVQRGLVEVSTGS